MSCLRLPLLGLMMLGLLLMISAAMLRPVAAEGMGAGCAATGPSMAAMHHASKTDAHHPGAIPLSESHLAHGALCDLICAGGFSITGPQRFLPKATAVSQLAPVPPDLRPDGQRPIPHLRPPILTSV